jgi:hypothetical protein
MTIKETLSQPLEHRVHGNPRPRLDAMGYTLKGGSPLTRQVRLHGEKRWRRVYMICFSNAGTAFIKVQGKMVVLSDSCFN